MRKLLRALFILVTIAALTIVFVETADGATVEVETLITQEAQAANVDPDLAIAIATVESKLDPTAVGALGEQGLFQLRPEFHVVAASDVRADVATALRYLARLRDVCTPRYGHAWFVCFNTGENRTLRRPLESAYYKRVLTIYRERVSKRKPRQPLLETKPYVTQD